MDGLGFDTALARLLNQRARTALARLLDQRARTALARLLDQRAGTALARLLNQRGSPPYDQRPAAPVDGGPLEIRR